MMDDDGVPSIFVEMFFVALKMEESKGKSMKNRLKAGPPLHEIVLFEEMIQHLPSLKPTVRP